MMSHSYQKTSILYKWARPLMGKPCPAGAEVPRRARPGNRVVGPRCVVHTVEALGTGLAQPLPHSVLVGPGQAGLCEKLFVDHQNIAAELVPAVTFI